MRKKGYKQMQRRLLRETLRRMTAETNREEAEKDAINARIREAELRRRLRSIGTNTETIDEDVPGALRIIRREINPERVGTWALVNPLEMDRNMEFFMRDMVQSIAEQIVDNDLAQLMVKEADPIGGPLSQVPMATLKVFVVPWEQMARSEAGQIELREAMIPGRGDT